MKDDHAQHPALRRGTTHKMYGRLMAAIVISVGALGMVIGVIFALPFLGMGEKALNIIGAGIGSAAAAAIAVGALEWDRTRKQAQVQEIIAGELESAADAHGLFAVWVQAGYPVTGRSMGIEALAALGEQVLGALEIAEQARGTVPKVAKVVLALRREKAKCEFLTQQHTTYAEPESEHVRDRAGEVVTAALVCSNWLRT